MVNVNTVYTTVLQILNKEQRGYVTPQEFNNLAQQVQLEIFESYFPDGTQLNRQNQNNTQNNTEFFNIFKNQNEKIFPFIKDLAFSYDALTTQPMWIYSVAGSATSGSIQESQIYWMGEILSKYNSSLVGNTDPKASSFGGEYITQLVTRADYNKITRSKLTAPTEKFPIDNSDLYPGDYLIDFANNIISSNAVLDFDNYDDVSEKLTELSIEQALLLIKKNLKSLGIKHDNFVKETNIANSNEVEKCLVNLTNAAKSGEENRPPQANTRVADGFARRTAAKQAVRPTAHGRLPTPARCGDE